MPEATHHGMPVGGLVLDNKLSRWRKKLATDAANAKIVMIGDSTTDAATAVGLAERLKTLHTLSGQALYGMSASNIISQGHNGTSLAFWLGNSTWISELAATGADLVIASFLINDVRLGLCDLPTAKARLDSMIATIQANLPGADIVLRIPNTLLTTDVGGAHYVQSSGGTINPAGAAQSYSELIRSAYLSFVDKYPFVHVCDVASDVFGTTAQSSHPLMGDQLHPTVTGSTIGGIPIGGGYVSIADRLAEDIGFKTKAIRSQEYYQSVYTGHVVAGGNGYIDIAKLPLGLRDADATRYEPAQYPISTSSLLIVDGVSSPFAITGAGFYRPFGPNNIRLLVSGTDFTSCTGRKIRIVSNSPGPTTQDRQIVSVNLPSIAAGAIGTTTASVTGARTGALHDATNVVCTPPASFVSAGLVLLNCYPSANDTVALVVQNPTGGAIDLAADNFAFWVIR